MEEVTLTEARNRWSELMDRVGHGEEIVLVDAQRHHAALLRPFTGADRLEHAWTTTQARREAGELVTAAQKGMQVVTVGSAPTVAVVAHEMRRSGGHADPGSMGIGDVLDGLLAPRAGAVGLSTGVHVLDRASGGLPRGKLTLVAAAPNAGGSLLPAQAARTAAFAVEQPRPVLYVPSGVPVEIAARRLVAAEAAVPYAQLASGSLDTGQRQAVVEAGERLRTAPLRFTRPAPTTAVIAQDAAQIQDLALVVVDRLQHVRAPETPLSGRGLAPAARALARLARDQDIAVVAVLDTDDAERVRELGADLTFHLTRTGDEALARIAVIERDLGVLETVTAPLDMVHLRFLNTPATPAPPVQPAPAELVREPASARREERPVPPPRPQRSQAGASRPAGTRPPAAVHKSGGKAAELAEVIEARVRSVLAETGGEVPEAIAVLNKTAIPSVMGALEKSRKGGRYDFRNHPDLPEILHKRGRDEADDIWEARPRFTAPSEVLDRVGDGVVTALDINGAYLSAFKAHLPIGQLEHHLGPDAGGPAHDPKRSGVHLVTPPAWDHPQLPNPIGDREEPGPLWITESTLRLLLRLSGPKAGLCEPPLIHESWTSGSTEQLLETLRSALVQVRTNALASRSAEGEVAYEYVKAMYSKFISTMGESNYNRDLYRQDWMHIIRSQAFANLWHKAWAAHQAGLTVVRMMGTDELHVVGDWRTARAPGKDRPLFPEGRGVSEVKPKQSYRLERTAGGSYREREVG
ncbi:DnaB-like helicase C-terminal domain-containing protein [Streptomyces iconiensis]|uniref:DnaB-like helicase C-terminal domain-containing protein n=1 Tax=Streptomyces iconiensis TaxID=1384038 RepID=A0ABT7A663_9ACTN|nr:DnaB-like helicase C-terminal domain-containing protein [Streptomyces iconiensis]MDJ1136832.1 DnaB-like helicase C-terminal domain-containing protein [Streptomyces iconiensis]